MRFRYKKPPVVNGGKMIMKRNIWGKIASYIILKVNLRL
jgi:hypothetical protein